MSSWALSRVFSTKSRRGGFSGFRGHAEPRGRALRDRAPQPIRPPEETSRQSEGLRRPPRNPHLSDVFPREPENGVLERRVLRVQRSHRLAVAPREGLVEARERGLRLGVRHRRPESIRIAKVGTTDARSAEATP